MQQYRLWLHVQFPPRRGIGGEPRFGRNRFEGESGGSQNQKAIDTRLDTPPMMSPLAAGQWSEGGGVSPIRNPSLLQMVPGMEGEQRSQVKIAANDTLMNEGHVSRDFEEGTIRKEWASSKGKNLVEGGVAGVLNKEMGGPTTEK